MPDKNTLSASFYSLICCDSQLFPKPQSSWTKWTVTHHRSLAHLDKREGIAHVRLQEIPAQQWACIPVKNDGYLQVNYNEMLTLAMTKQRSSFEKYEGLISLKNNNDVSLTGGGCDISRQMILNLIQGNLLNKSLGPSWIYKAASTVCGGILNKLTPENFSKLCLDILNVGIKSKVILKGIVILIFDKSIDEPRYSTLYANLCCRLYHEAPNFDPPPAQPIKVPHGSTLRPNTFRRLLIAKLQDEFGNRNKKLEAFDAKDGPLDADEEEQRSISKRHMLGNIKFIGELYRLDILQESIMHKCIKQLINKKKKGNINDIAEDLECLSQIMMTCGKKLDHPKAKSLMNQYFERIEVLRKKHSELPSRIRFLLQDVIELRRNEWVPRKVHRENGPKTLKQIHAEVVETYDIVNGENAYAGYQEDYRGTENFLGGFRATPNYQMQQQYPGRDSFFPPAPQYSGSYSEPYGQPGIPPGGDNEPSFDFFGSLNPQTPVRPTMEKKSPGNNMPPAPPTSNQGYDPRYNVGSRSQGPHLMHNGYSGYGSVSSEGRVSGNYASEQNFAVTKHGMRNGNAQSYKPDQKPGKEIPPRFQRQKQQQKEFSSNFGKAGPARKTESDNISCPGIGASLRNGGSLGPRKTPIFTSLNSGGVEPQIQQRPHQPRMPEVVPYAMPQGKYNAPTPYVSGGGLPGAKPKILQQTGVQQRPSPMHHPKRGVSGKRHPSPIINETNINAMQPPFQKVIDNANNQQTNLNKKQNSVVCEKAKWKKTSLIRVDVEKNCDEILENFFKGSKTRDQICRELSEAKIAKKHMNIVTGQALVKSLSENEEMREQTCDLLSQLLSLKMLTKENILEGIQTMFDKLAQLEPDILTIKSVTASIVARLAASDLVSLGDVGERLVGGYHFPLFLLTLQRMSKLKGQDWMTGSFKDSKIDMIQMLPEASQSKASMIAILEGKQLQFLFPLAHIEAKLTKQIRQNSNPTSIYKWIKENVNSDLYSDPGFISILVSCCLDHVTRSSSLAEDVDPTQNPAKDIKEKERHLLVEIKPVLQKFLHENQNLQLHALYSSQVYCFNKKFPKGLLLRLFNEMYEEDIIDEEAYFVWKEDVNDSYPGKGKALFQVNTWLKWLHEAEPEDDDAEE